MDDQVSKVLDKEVPVAREVSEAKEVPADKQILVAQQVPVAREALAGKAVKIKAAPKDTQVAVLRISLNHNHVSASSLRVGHRKTKWAIQEVDKTMQEEIKDLADEAKGVHEAVVRDLKVTLVGVLVKISVRVSKEEVLKALAETVVVATRVVALREEGVVVLKEVLVVVRVRKDTRAEVLRSVEMGSKVVVTQVAGPRVGEGADRGREGVRMAVKTDIPAAAPAVREALGIKRMSNNDFASKMVPSFNYTEQYKSDETVNKNRVYFL